MAIKIFLIFLLLIISIGNKISEGRESVDDLINLIEDKGTDWRVQITAIKKLAESPEPKVIETLLRVVKDPFLHYDCPALKFHAIVALGRFKDDPRIVETLIKEAADTSNPLSVREAAINSIGEIGDKIALNLLLNLINDKSYALRKSAIMALGKIGDSSIIPQLELLKRNDTDLSREVYLVLKKLRSNNTKK